MQCKHLVRGALAFVWLGADPALPQTAAEEGRLHIIMSKLPPQALSNYRAIRKRAGEATVQVLPLTKTEMWSVPRDRVAAVRKEAARYGARHGPGPTSAGTTSVSAWRADKHGGP